MTLLDDDARSNRTVQTFNTYQDSEIKVRRIGIDDDSPLMNHRRDALAASSRRRLLRRQQLLQKSMSKWVPSEDEEASILVHRRSLRRRIFLLITEPETSYLSAIFYFVLMAAIFASNVIMVMQTMETWQFTPDDCAVCGGTMTYNFEDDDTVNATSSSAGVACVCPPEPIQVTRRALRCLINFFSVEWCLRVITFVPEDPDPDVFRQVLQWFGYLTSPTTLLDAFATFPYYLEQMPNTFISLRLLRLFRIFQLVRLGQYNEMFRTLTNVMAKSLNYLRLLILILAFGGALFGSMIYWLEKGTWQYHAEREEYLFMRMGADGVTAEPSPFRSIPAAFWWFMVTATTVGYGDTYPTSPGGKLVACFAMLMGVLVIAFPVSVFSDLWSHELKQIQGFEDLNDEDGDAVLEEQGVEAHANKKVMAAAVNDNDKAAANEASTLRVQPGEPPVPTYGYPHRDTVVMDKDDLKEIVECVYNLKENQRKLHNILRKYRLHEDEHLGF